MQKGMTGRGLGVWHDRDMRDVGNGLRGWESAERRAPPQRENKTGVHLRFIDSGFEAPSHVVGDVIF